MTEIKPSPSHVLCFLFVGLRLVHQSQSEADTKDQRLGASTKEPYSSLPRYHLESVRCLW